MDGFEVRVADFSSSPDDRRRVADDVKITRYAIWTLSLAWPRRRGLRAIAAVIWTVAVTACGKVPSETTGDAPAPPVDSGPPRSPSLEGCQIAVGDRPVSTSSADAPRVSHLTIGAATSGVALSGSLQVEDPQSDAATLIVQVFGATTHLVCKLSSAEVVAKQIDLGRLTVSAGSSTESFFVYFGVGDEQGNVSGYALGTVVLGTLRPVSICGSAPLQVIGKAWSAATALYTAMNGTTPDYLLGPAPGMPISVVDRVQLYLDLGSCAHVLLASEPTAVAPVGWDNFLLVEYRTAPDQPVTRAWYYGGPGSTLINAQATQPMLVHEAGPTVAGTMLDPPVPSAAAFGYPPRTIDFMSNLPLGSTFELTLYVLDFGGAGSTTEIWLVSQ